MKARSKIKVEGQSGADSIKSRQRAEGQLRMKPDSILMPETDVGEHELVNIIDVPSIQSMADEFHKLTGMGVWILDLKGTVLVGVGWQDICTKYHRIHPQAAQYGFERKSYLEALRRVPRFDRDNVWTLMALPVKFTTLVSNMGYGNLTLTKALYDQKWVEGELKKHHEHLEELVKERTVELESEITERKRTEEALRESESKFKRLYDSNIIGIIFWDIAGNISRANSEFLRIVGYTEKSSSQSKIFG